MFVTRFKVWGLCLSTLCIAVAINFFAHKWIAINLFSLTFWGFVPVGAIALALIALSGFMLGAGFLNYRSDGVDVGFLMAVCLSLQLLVVAVDYWVLLMAHSQVASQLSFGQFFARHISLSKLTSYSREMGGATQVAGDAGFMLLIPRIGVLLAMAKIASTMDFRELGELTRHGIKEQGPGAIF
ncbi:MAG: hypothetical protein V4857_22215 [Pseudomonadota bacterium]